VLAEVADDLVVGSLPAPGGAGMPEWREASRWREIEIELVTGPRGLLDSAGGLLRRAGAAPSAAASKLSRLLASAPGAP
jgi:hypothetical protein